MNRMNGILSAVTIFMCAMPASGQEQFFTDGKSIDGWKRWAKCAQ